MKSDALNEMEIILGIKFQRKQHLFSKILMEEQRIRSQLTKLKEEERKSEQSYDDQIKAIGADVIWKAWIHRTRVRLNLELAQVLAQKENLLSSVRSEYGKLLVSRELMSEAKKTKVKQRQGRLLDAAIESSLFR